MNNPNNNNNANFNFQVRTDQHLPQGLRQFILNNLQQRLLSILQQNLRSNNALPGQQYSTFQQPQPQLLNQPSMFMQQPIFQQPQPMMYQQPQLPIYQQPQPMMYQQPQLPMYQQPQINPFMRQNSPMLNQPNLSSMANTLNLLNEARQANNRRNLLNDILRPPNATMDVLLFDDGRMEIANTNNMENFFDPVPVSSSINDLRNSSSIEVYNSTTTQLCSICQGDMSNGEVTRKINHCGHFFHIDCIDTWFENHVACPVCRHDIRDSSGPAPSNTSTTATNTPLATNITPSTTNDNIPSMSTNNPGNSSLSRPDFSHFFRQLMLNQAANNTTSSTTSEPTTTGTPPTTNTPPVTDVNPLARSPNSTQLLNLIERYRNMQQQNNNNNNNNDNNDDINGLD